MGGISHRSRLVNGGGISWTTRMLLASTADAKRVRYNPRPAGQVQSGSATAEVLRILQTHCNRRWRRSQLIAITGRSESAVDWALLYLRAQNLIEGEAGMAGRQWTYWLCVAKSPAEDATR